MIDRQLEVHRKPTPEGAEPFGHRYTNVTSYGPSDSVSPLAARRSKIKVSDLLP